jgi:hypothetical protein
VIGATETSENATKEESTILEVVRTRRLGNGRGDIANPSLWADLGDNDGQWPELAPAAGLHEYG